MYPVHWGDKPYHSLDYELRQTFGEKVYRLSLNGGMTCPNRDGTVNTGGCIFCSSGGSGDFPQLPPSLSQRRLSRQNPVFVRRPPVKSSSPIFRLTRTRMPRWTTYGHCLPRPSSIRILQLCPSQPAVTVCLQNVLDLLEELNRIKPVWIELGLQSIHDTTLDAIHSGFHYTQYLDAVYALSDRNIPVITHLILGLPGESQEMMLASVRQVASLPVSGIKLQLLHVLKGTELGSLYEASPFPLFSMEEYCDFIVTCIELLPPEITIHRITGDGPRSLLLAPLWSTGIKNGV